jgi:integrase
LRGRAPAGCHDPVAKALVFATGTGAPQSPSNIRNRVLARSVKLADEYRAGEGLGPLPDGLTPHSLRRTFISLLLAAGEDAPFVMQQVGHTDPKVTLGVYAQVMFRRDGERERLRELLQATIHVPEPQSTTRPQTTA